MSETPSPNFWVIIPAAGIGSRMQADRPKQYLEVAGQTILEHTVHCFLSHPKFQSVSLGLSKDDDYWNDLPLSSNRHIKLFEGGKERVDSVLNGLDSLLGLAKPDDWVWVHDAARPCLSHHEIDDIINALVDVDDGVVLDGIVLAVPVYDTVKRANKDAQIIQTVDREGLWRAMTPQVFRFAQLKSALECSLDEQVCVTDESSAIEFCGGKPVLILGSDKNIKVTHPQDLGVVARTITENSGDADDEQVTESRGMTDLRIGTGFDVHAFGEGSEIILGGVVIPYTQGLIAHSDGDVLLHAIMDALLGALALGDIGKHFPDTDEERKGADSRKLLRAVVSLIKQRGYRLGNLDSTIMAQEPKMAPHIDAMCHKLAQDLEVGVSDVSVKATTTERLGFTGRKEGIACQASVLLVKDSIE